MTRHAFPVRVLAAFCACVLAVLAMAAPAGAQVLAPGDCEITSALSPLYEIGGFEIRQDVPLNTVTTTSSFSITCAATTTPISISVSSTGNLGELSSPAGKISYALCPSVPSLSCNAPFSTQFPGGTWTSIAAGSGNVTVSFNFVPVLRTQPAPRVSQSHYTDTLTVTAGNNQPLIVPLQVQVISGCIFGSLPGAPPTYRLRLGVGGGTQTTEATAAGSMQISCSQGAHYSITANEGMNFDPARSTRQLLRSGATGDCTTSGNCLDYKLLMDPAGPEWGGTPTQPAGAAAITGLATGATQAVPFYGLVPQGQTLQAGTYKDTVQLTISVDN
jgi:spore coat protein U-like protein